MLEMNKEYTYKEIIKELDWTEYKGGCSRTAQINEIEGAFNFYHPMNKKTHKEKKSYIFTEQLREPVEPSKSNCGGAHNTKNIKPMIDYMQSYLSDDVVNGDYRSMTTWFCDILDLLNKDLCNVVYQGEEEIADYCSKHSIHNRRLLEDYVSTARKFLKDIFLKALEHMEKKDLCEYYKGHIFIYEMTNKRFGFYGTHTLNDLIIANETTICNDLKEEHNLSEKLKGRQLLMQIYNRKDLTEAFNEFKILELMGDDKAIKQLNEEMECEYGCGCTAIDTDHPLVNYYNGVAITDMEFTNIDNMEQKDLQQQVAIIVRDKTEKALYAKNWTNKQTNERHYYYDSFEHSAEMYEISKLLFVPSIPPANVIPDDDLEELDFLFGAV